MHDDRNLEPSNKVVAKKTKRERTSSYFIKLYFELYLHQLLSKKEKKRDKVNIGD